MEKKTDLRVIKTRLALTGALYALMCEKSFDDITVTELCERAMVRKATFYKHFGDKTELLVYMVRELQRKSEEENTIGYDPAIPQSYYIGVFRFFLEYMEKNDRFVRNVLKSSSSAMVLGTIQEETMRGMDERLRRESKKEIREAHAMLAAAYAGAMISCGTWWAKQNPRPDRERVIGQFSELIMRL